MNDEIAGNAVRNGRASATKTKNVHFRFVLICTYFRTIECSFQIDSCDMCD